MIDFRNAVQFQHIFWQEVLPTARVIVDATCGNGYDLEYLLRHAQAGAAVTAIDIQVEAIAASRERIARLNKETLLAIEASSIRYLHQSHREALQDSALWKAPIDLLVFNLGYLPSGDHKLMTTPEHTIGAVEVGLSRLSKKGILTIVSYPGTEEGRAEDRELRKYLQTVPQKGFEISSWSPVNQVNHPPILYIVRRH